MVPCFLLAYLYIGYWYRSCSNLSSNCISDIFLTAVKPENTSGVPFLFAFNLFFWFDFRKISNTFLRALKSLSQTCQLLLKQTRCYISLCSAASKDNCHTLALDALPLKGFFYSFCGIASSKHVSQSYLPSVSPLNKTPPTYLLDFNL